MKRNALILLAGMALLLAVSCASAPKKGAELPQALIQAKAAADDSRAKAIGIKAGVAAKALFDQGETAYTAAKDLETAADYEKATAGYTGAADAFVKAYDEAAAKKDLALKAMDKAATERKTSEDALSKADDERKAAGDSGKGE